MAINIDSFLVDLMQGVAARASSSGELTRTVFVEELANRLIEAEELQDWTPCYYDGRGSRNRAIAVDGYSTDELDFDGSLSVLIADFRTGETVEPLSTADINSAFTRAANFTMDARAGRLHDAVEPSTPAADFARLIHESRDILKAVRVLLISNSVVGNRAKEPRRQSIDGVKVELHLWDLGRFSQLAAAGGREEVDIDLTTFSSDGLPVLPASLGNSGYSAYLCVIPGILLADLYEQYGSRLLESNVRAFLSTRGSVNKAIRHTILKQPERFFAFNNGITATATAVDVISGGSLTRVTRIRNLQIVNGGQTTASLYNARVKDKASLEHVFVQMKLSVLPPNIAELMVPEISRYANTQNKVSDADLFANHPFHRKVEELSRRLWAPAKDGSRQLTHWFYERARAQYQTEQGRLSPARRREFILQNPKDQVITKTDLAKYENTWTKLPHIVSLGAQKNFVRYAEKIREAYDAHPEDFNERWFHHLVAKALIFKTAEQVVSQAQWYTHAYRANIVTYAIARLVLLVESVFPGRALDLDQIWKTQQVPAAIAQQIDRAGELVLKVLTTPPPSYSNVTEWAKKVPCWERIASTPLEPVAGLESALKPLDKDRKRGSVSKVRDR